MIRSMRVVALVLGLAISTEATAGFATFFGSSSSGTGTIEGQSFSWSATDSLINAPGSGGSSSLGWGRSGDPTSQGLDFDIVIDFPEAWHFNQIRFGSLNHRAGLSKFSVSMLDELGNVIDTSALTAATTSGFAAAP